jgi:hypothetical protein
VRLQLHALAPNLGNFMGRLVMPNTPEPWSLTSLREKLIKFGAKVISHGRGGFGFPPVASGPQVKGGWLLMEPYSQKCILSLTLCTHRDNARDRVSLHYLESRRGRRITTS